MLRRAILIFYGAFSVAICLAGYYFGQNIPFAQQWPLYEALRNTASIIFAVVGAWLAIIYPERLKLSFRSEQGPKTTGPNIGLLLTPAVHSTILLVILLLIGIVAPIAKQLPLLSGYVEPCRGASFVILAALTLWQVMIVIMTVFPAELIQTQSDIDAAEQTMRRHYGKLRQHQRKDIDQGER